MVCIWAPAIQAVLANYFKVVLGFEKIFHMPEMTKGQGEKKGFGCLDKPADVTQDGIRWGSQHQLPLWSSTLKMSKVMENHQGATWDTAGSMFVCVNVFFLKNKVSSPETEQLLSSSL